jgi:hypothetical protein
LQINKDGTVCVSIKKISDQKHENVKRLNRLLSDVIKKKVEIVNQPLKKQQVIKYHMVQTKEPEISRIVDSYDDFRKKEFEKLVGRSTNKYLFKLDGEEYILANDKLRRLAIKYIQKIRVSKKMMEKEEEHFKDINRKRKETGLPPIDMRTYKADLRNPKSKMIAGVIDSIKKYKDTIYLMKNYLIGLSKGEIYDTAYKRSKVKKELKKKQEKQEENILKKKKEEALKDFKKDPIIKEIFEDIEFDEEDEPQDRSDNGIKKRLEDKIYFAQQRFNRFDEELDFYNHPNLNIHKKKVRQDKVRIETDKEKSNQDLIKLQNAFNKYF